MTFENVCTVYKVKLFERKVLKYLQIWIFFCNFVQDFESEINGTQPR